MHALRPGRTDMVEVSRLQGNTYMVRCASRANRTSYDGVQRAAGGVAVGSRGLPVGWRCGVALAPLWGRATLDSAQLEETRLEVLGVVV